MVKIPEGWIETTLSEIAEIIMGQSPKGESYNLNGDGLPFYQGVTEFSEKYVGLKTYTTQPTKVIGPGTILFSVRAPVGKVNFTKWEACIGRGNAGIIMKNGNQEYLFYLLKYIESQILKSASGTVFDSISGKELQKISVTVPQNPQEQKAIAGVLSAFDDKIELLRAENQTLEEMGQSLFKERFKPPYPLKGEVNGKVNSKSPSGDLGAELPDGWKVGKLGDIIELQGGYVHNPNLQGEVKCKIAKMGVVDGKTRFNRNSVIDYYEDINEKHKLCEDDLIVCTRDVTYDRIIIGNVARVPKDLADFGLYAGANTWIIKTDYDKNYLFYMLRDSEFRNHIKESAKGSTIIMITKDAFLNRDIVIPDNLYIKEKMEILNPIIKKIKTNSEEIESLSNTRDQLLPKLMSGEVRVEF